MKTGNEHRESVNKALPELLQELAPVTLAELSGNLQDRYDEKYHVPEELFMVLLRQAGDHYRVLEVQGVRDYAYVSTYLDLPGLPMYLAHHNGRRDRYKVRFRRYIHSGKVYLEVKHKSNKGRTVKKRVARPAEEERLTEVSQRFIRSLTPFDPGLLSPVLRVAFSRITLASPDGTERITWDHGLRFGARGHEVQLHGFGVMEIKHAGRKHASPMTRLLQHYRINPSGFSKYCTGIVLLYPQMKYNRFKPLIRKLKTESHDLVTSAADG